MSTPGLLALQQGVFTYLSGLASLQALLGNPARVYDVPPPDATYPFILIGEMTSSQWSTRDHAGLEVELSVLAFSDVNRGSADIKAIGDAVIEALDNQESAIALAAGSVVLCQTLSTGEEETKDGTTWMGTTKFRILLQLT